MTIPVPVQFKGVPGSPYTRKMLALLRYRQIPYELLVGSHTLASKSEATSLPRPRVDLLPTFYLPDEKGELQAVVDSTPLARRFEVEVDGRSAVPADPVLAFLNYLIEDYGDEWLTKAMFHYRWHYAADTNMAKQVLPLWANLTADAEEHEKAARFFSDRQISRLRVVGSNPVTAPLIENGYQRFLTIFDKVIQRQGFVFGGRPSTADFALYAQLTQLAGFDPTPTAIALQTAPRVYAWVQVTDDLSGNPACDDDWIDRSQARELLGGLLQEIGRVYAPLLLANASAVSNGENEFCADIDGLTWEQPVFPYQAKCLQWIRQEYAALSESDRLAVDGILAGTGCDTLLTK